MSRRLLDRPEITSHDVVTRAMHRTGSDDFDGTEWIPALEVLTRSLDREAGLSLPGRRRVRGELVDLLVARRIVPDAVRGARRPVVLITGPEPAGIAALDVALGAPAGRGERLLRSAFASMSFETEWHVPAYAEWLAELDSGAWCADLARRSGFVDDPAPVEVVGAVQLGEHLDAARRAFPGALVVEIERPLDDAVVATTALSVEQRAAVSREVDAAKVERYWRWRLGLRAERRAAGGVTADLTLTHDDLVADPAATARLVLSAAGLPPA